MLINHNILRIIVDKIALSRWRTQINNVCLDYRKNFHTLYSILYKGTALAVRRCMCKRCGERYTRSYNYERRVKVVSSLKVCWDCSEIQLPKNY